jgi:CheY-like chemotaxis protein
MGVVLIVEDDEQVRVLVESAIQEISHSTLTAASVEEALALLRDEQQQIDLIFTDIRLWVALPSPRKRAISAPPFECSIQPAMGVMTDGMRALFVDGFLFRAKPYNLDVLRASSRNNSDRLRPCWGAR